MRLRLLAVGLCSASAVLTGLTVPLLSSPAGAATPRTTVRVASFNISTVSSDSKASGNHRRWKFRRPVVVSQILRRKLDVIGLQEANQSSIYARSLRYGVNQYLDLKGALNAKGGHYALTNRSAYNCLRSTSAQRCHYRNRGASGDNRILYNTRTLSMVHQGSVRFRHQKAGKNTRYLAWAIFRSRHTGRQFFFVDTHLDPYSTSVRKAQWRELIAHIDRLKHSRPVVAVGDFNSSKFDSYTRTFLPAMKRHGYGDVVNQSYRHPLASPRRAQTSSRGWVNSFNAYRRNIRPYAYEDARRKVGNGIDWIFAGNRMLVRHWEVVTNVNPRTLRVRGVMPSDHSMVRATLTIR